MTTAYLFPGQGSQFVGMGRDLYAASESARQLYDQANAYLGFDLAGLCFDGPESELTATVNQQPALLVTSLAAWGILQERGAFPSAGYMAGHSMGEFSALVAAGSLTFKDGLALVRRRAELMHQAGKAYPGAMAAVLGMDIPPLVAICAAAAAETNRPVQIANDNCPGQVVLSGDETALDNALARAEAAGARKIVKLPITIAAHSQLMASAAPPFAAAVDATPISAPVVPIIGNVSAIPLTSPDAIRAELKAQLTASVQWNDSMGFLLAQGVRQFIEVGPGDVLSKLMRRIDRSVDRVSFSA